MVEWLFNLNEYLAKISYGYDIQSLEISGMVFTCYTHSNEVIMWTDKKEHDSKNGLYKQKSMRNPYRSDLSTGVAPILGRELQDRIYNNIEDIIRGFKDEIERLKPILEIENKERLERVERRENEDKERKLRLIINFDIKFLNKNTITEEQSTELTKCLLEADNP